MWHIKVKKINPSANIPYKRKEDAWYDLYGIFTKDYQIFAPGEIIMISTWIAFEIPEWKALFISERSSTWSKWIARRCGIVDSWYRWEVFVVLNNTSNKNILFYKHDDDNKLEDFIKENSLNKEDLTLYPQSKAIAQAMILDAFHYEFKEVDELSESQRWSWSLWSTNK